MCPSPTISRTDSGRGWGKTLAWRWSLYCVSKDCVMPRVSLSPMTMSASRWTEPISLRRW
eukprot:1414367-Alexandrium_andersonii.AAC.1